MKKKSSSQPVASKASTNFGDPGNFSGDVQATILESISDGVFTVDHEWRITSFNRAAEEITGIPRETAIGSLCREVFRANMCEKNCALKRSTKEGKSFISSATTIQNRRGELVPVEVATAPLRSPEGDTVGGVETFRDRSLVEELRKELDNTVQSGPIVSKATSMKRILDILPQVAESDSTVLIQGETGTGKELLARTIHDLSARTTERFTAINCGALPDTLLESELFGYKAGAFTGADRDKPGLFSGAANGTILLDEIGDTSLAFQIRLLRVLEDREFQPLGSVKKERTNARVLAATHKNLEDMIEQGLFRQDLYYRINIVRLELPPLRDRIEDLPFLLERFIRQMNIRRDASVSGVDSEVLRLLSRHAYPGNIRELENIIEHAFVLCKDGVIQLEHLPPYLSGITHSGSSQVAETVSAESMKSVIVSTESRVILEALVRNGYNRKAAAADLGMHKATLHRKIRRYNIPLPAVDGRNRKE